MNSDRQILIRRAAVLDHGLARALGVTKLDGGEDNLMPHQYSLLQRQPVGLGDGEHLSAQRLLLNVAEHLRDDDGDAVASGLREQAVELDVEVDEVLIVFRGRLRLLQALAQLLQIGCAAPPSMTPCMMKSTVPSGQR